MTHGKVHFGIGLVSGMLIAAFLLLVFAPRYNTMEQDGVRVKHDRWSGQSWRLVDNEWQPIETSARDWKPVDAALRRALNISERKQEINEGLDLLRQEYAALRHVSDEELMERIKVVYARDILRDLYLERFMQLHQASKTPSPTD